METKQVTIGQLLSVTTGVFACKDFGQIYDILNFMTQDDLFTHQLPRASKEAAPYLLEQHPWLNNISKEDIVGEQCSDKVEALALQYGEWHEIIPMHFDDHAVIDPVEELKAMRPDITLIEVEVSEPPSPYGDINWQAN